MDTHTRAMVRFVQMWHPYGGCDEQIMPEFGVTVPTFYGRILTILEHWKNLPLDDGERKALTSFCVAKLQEHRQSDRAGLAGARRRPTPAPGTSGT
ncbi:hypothetical protein GCM10023094_32920 [Rhodococcus olei]|uniref:DUF3263 domain-containing protein n=1 Tax=Rhodococcus olei TaxID=2161675 RepID=A0ABP8P7C0_9NOCA